MSKVIIRGVELTYQQLLNLLNSECPFNKTYYYRTNEDQWFSVNHEDDNNLIIYKDINDLIGSVENYIDNYMMPLKIIKQVPKHLAYTQDCAYNDDVIEYWDADGEHEIKNDGSDVWDQIKRYLESL